MTIIAIGVLIFNIYIFGVNDGRSCAEKKQKTICKITEDNNGTQLQASRQD